MKLRFRMEFAAENWAASWSQWCLR
jgi:hypothetical protein